MRKLLSIISCTILLCLSYTIAAQSTFNNRFVQDFDWATIRAVAATDTAYYASGPCGSDPWGSAFYTFDLEGNLIHTKFLKDTAIRFELWAHDLIPTERNSFIAGGYAYNSFTGRKEGLLAEYFPALDSVRYQLFIYDDPVYIDKFGGFFSVSYANGEILLSTTVNHPDVWNSEQVIFKFNLNFDLLETRFLYHPKRDGHGVIKSIGNSTFLLSYLEDQGVFRYSQQLWFRQFDDQGNLIKEYLTPEDETWTLPGNFVKTNDSGFLLAGANGYQYNFPSGNDSMSFPLYFPYVLKLSENLEREWTMTFGQGQEGDGRIEDIYDDNGEYVVTGHSDYPYAIPENFRVFGIVAKITADGEKIWDRRLHWMDTINHKHTLRSIAPAPDGGYLLGGQVSSYEPPPSPGQRAWLLKVDEYGCIVPGCQGPVSATEPIEAELVAPLLFPNPVSGLLSIFIPIQAPYQEGKISITNASGKIIHQYEGVLDNATYLLDVAHWPAGVYYLKYAVNTGLSSIVKWVKI